MPRVCGPILGFRGQDGEAWRLTVLVVHRGDEVPGALTVSGTSAEPVLLGEAGGLRFFGYAFVVPLQAAEHTVEYAIAGEGARWSFTVPAAGQDPRIAYASCNGFSTPGDMKTIADKNALWTGLLDEHARQPFHMLLMGGDQLYADQLWDAVPALRRFNERPRDERVKAAAPPSLRRAIEAFYIETCRERFSQPPVARALASIPALMMWDDHDIFDGWGSYSDAEQSSPVFQAVFAAARTAFALFQLQSDPQAPAWPRLPGQNAFNALLRIGGIGLLVLDLRSERTQRQILAPATWDVVLEALDRTDGLRHLLVMSSIPVVHPDMSFLERTLDVLPGAQDIEDDLHDQWVGYNHRIERLRLLHRLLDFADAKGTRVTILSGDVHVAALGVVESTRRPPRRINASVINQLTSSAIVHPPPPRIVRYFLEQLGTRVDDLDGDLRVQMLQFPGTNYRFVAARNWLSLDFDERHRIWANWHVEAAEVPLTKVIHPCEEEGELVRPPLRR